jgi:hypothetical protein
MAKPGIETVETTDTFQVWLAKTNELVTLFRVNAVTASPAGDITDGNATITGTFSANTINVVDTMSANTASIVSVRNRGTITTPIGIQSPLSVNNTERTLLSLTAGAGPIVEMTNQFPVTWKFGLSSSGQEAELQFARGTAEPMMRMTQTGVIISGSATINQDLTILGSVNGNISTASALATSRTISASGDIVWSVSFNGSSNVSGIATIQNDSVTNAKFRQSTALSVVGRSTNTTGDVADISASTDHQVLRRSGTTLGFGAIALNQSAAVTGTLAVANGGTGQSSFTAGRILFGGATINSDAALFWDNTNKRLGVNTTTPTERIDVVGNVKADLFIGRATSANYADLAEKFIPDQEYPAGTVVYIGGEREITASVSGCKAIGVVSEFPALMMNAGQQDGIFVALKGRVPVFVVDNIKKGDILIPADNGKAAKGSIDSKNSIGIALSDSSNGKVEMLVL